MHYAVDYYRRRARGRARIQRQRSTWFLSRHNLATAAAEAARGRWLGSEYAAILRAVAARPWGYRTEFVCGYCRAVDCLDLISEGTAKCLESLDTSSPVVGSCVR